MEDKLYYQHIMCQVSEQSAQKGKKKKKKKPSFCNKIPHKIEAWMEA